MSPSQQQGVHPSGSTVADAADQETGNLRISSFDLPPLDLNELSPLPPAQAIPNPSKARQSATWTPSASRTSSSPSSGPLKDGSSVHSSSAGQVAEENVNKRPELKVVLDDINPESTSTPSQLSQSARYVTVSAILSRSEMYYPQDSKHRDMLRSIAAQDSILTQDDAPLVSRDSLEASTNSLRRRSQRKRPSNGSAIEALGALLLRKDSSGKVASLSFEPDDAKKTKRPVFQSWTSALNTLSGGRIDINLPKERSSSDNKTSTGTIAERRAAMWKAMSSRKAAVIEDQHNGFSRVKSVKDGLSFEVSTKNRKRAPSTILDNYEAVRNDDSAKPRLLTLSAGKRPQLRAKAMSEFGLGSSVHDHDLPEAPPSPVAMPGAWHGGSMWRARPGEGYEEGTLLLPPPLLDDQGSDANSFEGLLGIRRMREMEKVRKQAEKLAARNRPTHKVGPLTALSNFVMAAHAAEKSIQRAKSQISRGRPSLLNRSQTEPLQKTVTDRLEPVSPFLTSKEASLASVADARVSPKENGSPQQLFEKDAVTETSPRVKSHATSRKVSMSRRNSRNDSLDLGSRQLNTLFEAVPFDPANIPDNELASPDLPPLSSPLLRPTSYTSITSAFRDFPHAPRLLPVQLSVPPSPFTPLAIDYRGKTNGISTPTGQDYLSARNLPTAPGTPRLMPTMLSLPPSPWISDQDGSGPIMHLHLNASSSSLRLQPGTPRLIPTHIEVLPSPFPTAPSSRRGSLTRDAGAISSARNKTDNKSPPTKVKDSGRPHAPFRSQSLERYNCTVDRKTAEFTAPQTNLEVDEQAQSGRPGSDRVTPTTMLRTAQTRLAASIPQPPAELEHVSPTEAQRSPLRRLSSTDKDPVHVDASGQPRSFVLWFLIGDIGLRSNRSKTETNMVRDYHDDYGALIGAVMHLFGFLLFLAAHLIDLGYQVCEQISLIVWFMRWTFLNLTGSTVLSQCMVEAYRFIQAEWTTVANEDHEMKGDKRSPHDGSRRPKGLSRWQVLRGLLEIYCLHDVTRDRYLEEGAGIKKINSWTRRSERDSATAQDTWTKGRLDIGSHRSAARNALDESTRENKLRATSSQENVTLSANSDEDMADDGDSSDEEMIVTSRGHDILEFAKTPRLGPSRPGQQRKESGYFGRAYDFMTSPQVGASLSAKGTQEPLPLRESNRDLIRTIKWCGRLAISAYGLHVHIVDLPPTFTPSGNRFSRQTFAYLSRLDAEDVLHADIQTLDADADYSPTFYVVRDFVRKVVCVAVRGTQSFSDIIVDLDLQTEEVELPQAQPSPGEEFRCHAGIWRAAKALVSPQSSLFAKLRQALEENEGFGIMFCGHSLGGAIASAAALILAEYFIPDGADPVTGAWVTNMSSGLPARRPIRAVSFASPVTMTADLAARAALGSVPLVMTVVLGSDLIPRMGHGQVRELRRVLGALSRVRRRHALAAEGQDDARVHILRSYWDWRAIGKAVQADDVMLHRKERIEEQLWSLRREVESDLYAAVKARSDVQGDSIGGSRVPPSPWVGPEQRNQAPLHKLAARRQEMDSVTLRSEAAQGGPLIPPGKCIWINGKDVYHVESPLSFFSLPELRSDMFAMHFPAAYEEAILALKT